MGSLGAYFCGGFEEMRDVIGHRLRVTQRSGCLVVVVFANARTELYTKHLRPYLGEWHYRSADLVEFVFPGYQGLGDPKEHMFKPDLYDNAYQDHTFVNATEEFQARSAWRYTGEPAVIICNASLPSKSIEDSLPANFHLASCVVFDLAEALKKQAIRSVPSFFQSIIAFAKENPTYATAWNFSDSVGIRNLLDQDKEGLIKTVSTQEKIMPDTSFNLGVARMGQQHDEDLRFDVALSYSAANAWAACDLHNILAQHGFSAYCYDYQADYAHGRLRSELRDIYLDSSINVIVWSVAYRDQPSDSLVAMERRCIANRHIEKGDAKSLAILLIDETPLDRDLDEILGHKLTKFGVSDFARFLIERLKNVRS